MPGVKLGRRTVAQIQTPEKPTYYYDTDLTGFGLRVLPSNVRTYFVEYRPGAGGRGAPTRRMSLGRTGVLSPEKARELASRLLASVKLGQDPAISRSEERRASIVSDLFERYRKERWITQKPTTLLTYAGQWQGHILPALGSRRARDVTNSDIARLHRKIGSTSRTTANRVLVQLNCFFAWAISQGEIKGQNPATNIEKFEEVERERFLGKAEISRLGAAILEAETVGIPWKLDPSKKSKHVAKLIGPNIDELTAAALRLIIFTGARHREILHLKWSNVDLERGILFLDDSKTGKKSIVLNNPALAILGTLPRKGPYVFPADVPSRPKKERKAQIEARPRTSLKTAWGTIRKRAGLDDVRIHDLRHTFASVGVGESLGLPIVGKLLGHARAASTQRYAHLEADPARRASNMIGGAIETSLNAGVAR